MRRVVSLLLLATLLAPSFPFPLLAQEIGSTTDSTVPEVLVATTTPPEATGTEPQVPIEQPASMLQAIDALVAPTINFAPTVQGVVLASSSDSSWNPDLWRINFSYSLGLENLLSEEGTLTHIVMPLGYFFDAPDFPISFSIRDAFGNSYDCGTEEKTMAEWGIYNNARARNWNTVTIGPFTGKDCDTAKRFSPARGGVFRLSVNTSTGASVGGNLGTPGYIDPDTGNIEQPYIVYIEDVPPPTCAENCNSSVLFLPGLKGSILELGTDTLWPADLSGTDFPQLALNEDGTSVNSVVVNGILPSFKIHIPALGDVGPEIYSGFMTYMDGLVASGIIQEWEPLPYDWRYSPEYIVSHDIQTPHGPVNLVAEVERMASTTHSRTGKVTIVAHSMGGLVGKALIKALEEKGEAGLIDSFVMVGSPELGTPQAAASLLHGDEEGIPGKGIFPNFVATRSVVRGVGRNLPGAYSLLPSASYFQKITDPAITFDPVFFTEEWRNYFGAAGINSYQPFTQFLTGTGVTRTRPNPTLISIPEVLRPDLVNAAGTLHDTLDTYPIPSSIRVVEIAGWGEETTKAINYNAPHLIQSYETVPTIEGDGIVVYASAVANGTEDYYYNLDLDNSGFNHGTLLNSPSIQEVVGEVIKGSTVTKTSFISDTKPNTTDVQQKLRVSSYSPVILGAYDSLGNFTGVYPKQDLSGAYLYAEENIPGSSFTASGDTQSLYLPKEGTYTFVYKGTGAGPTTIKVENFSNDVLSPVSTYADIPTTSNTSATFSIDSAVPQESKIQVDQNGDGQTDTYVAPEGGSLSLAELIVNLKTAVNGISFSKPQQKTQLLNKITNIEQKIVKQKEKQTKVLAKLQVQIAKKAGKGKIDQGTAGDLNILLDQLMAGDALLPLDTALVRELKGKIISANIPLSLQTSLLSKIAKLESVIGINRSIDNMSKAVAKKGSKGILSEVEMRNLLNLLDQIQAAL